MTNVTDWNTMAIVRCKLHNLFKSCDSNILHIFKENMNNSSLTNGMNLTNTATIIDQSSDTVKLSFLINDDGISIAGDCSVRTAETVLYVELMNILSNVLRLTINVCANSDSNNSELMDILNTINSITNQSSIAVLFDIIIYNDHFDVSI